LVTVSDVPKDQVSVTASGISLSIGARLEPSKAYTVTLADGARDRFGRLLYYAYRADGTFLNAELVANGYADIMSIRPNVAHADELRALGRRARSQRLGLWGACH